MALTRKNGPEDSCEILSCSQAETESFAADCARGAQSGDIFALHGNLGAGKSVFARAFIRTLCGADTDVPSPTFTLVQTYDGENGTLWHFDLYRLESAEEVYEIGWEEALSEGIVLVEWPERLGGLLPRPRTDIKFTVLDGESRKISCVQQEGKT
jgi:tRNA threonylcarbamoyladenosine biosynthesis protein TsaE